MGLPSDVALYEVRSEANAYLPGGPLQLNPKFLPRPFGVQVEREELLGVSVVCRIHSIALTVIT